MTTPSMRRDLFGDISVAKGFLTWAQVRDTLKRQQQYRQKGISIRIGEIAVESKLLTQVQCNEILAEQAQRRKDLAPAKAASKIPDFNEDDDGGSFMLGRYRLDKRLGGVMGIVYRGVDTQTEKTVALKVLPKHFAQDLMFVERFKREVRASSSLTHPNIVGTYDAGVEQGIFYLATEFIDGETLTQRLARDVAMNENDGLEIGRQVALALAAAHKHNLLHRDVKPDNIMISKAGEVKLADFGLAKFLEDESRITADGIAVGTPHYISPEQARALKETDHRSDLYSLGATLFHCITGRLPYEGEDGAEVMKRHVFEETPDPRTICPKMSEFCAKLLMKLMAKDPASRYQTASEVAQAIEAHLNPGATAQPAPQSAPDEPPKPAVQSPPMRRRPFI